MSENQLCRFSDATIRQKQIEFALAASHTRADQVKNDENVKRAASEAAQKSSKKLVLEGRHNFCGGEMQRVINNKPEIKEKHKANARRRIEAGQHIFQDPQFIESQREKIRNHWASMTPEERKQRGFNISKGRKKKEGDSK